VLRRKAVNKYYSSMHGLLRIRYGISEGYSSGQVEATIKECDFSMKYIPYALALFVEERSLKEHLSKEYPDTNVEQLRTYIAKRFFHGDLDYKYCHKDVNARLVDSMTNQSIGKLTPDINS